MRIKRDTPLWRSHRATVILALICQIIVLAIFLQDEPDEYMLSLAIFACFNLGTLLLSMYATAVVAIALVVLFGVTTQTASLQSASPFIFVTLAGVMGLLAFITSDNLIRWMTRKSRMGSERT